MESKREDFNNNLENISFKNLKFNHHHTQANRVKTKTQMKNIFLLAASPKKAANIWRKIVSPTSYAWLEEDGKNI